MEWITKALEWLINKAFSFINNLVGGMLEAMATGVPPESLIKTHEFIKGAGGYALAFALVGFIVLLGWRIAKKKWPELEVPRGAPQITLGLGLFGVYFFFLGAWGLVPPLAIVAFFVWAFTRLIKPHK